MGPDTDALAAGLASRYRLEGVVGRGGMATVFRAEDLRHRRLVALKVLRPELSLMLGAERLVGEIRVTAHLQHPHILALYDSGEAAGLLFYVMPCVGGGSLRHKLEHEGPLSVDRALTIAREVADALGHVHAHGVVHRDGDAKRAGFWHRAWVETDPDLDPLRTDQRFQRLLAEPG